LAAVREVGWVMLGAVGHDIDGASFRLSFREPPLNQRSGMPVLVGMGDPVLGPLLGLFYDAPSTPEELAGPPDLTTAHSHPCDNFRVVIKGELWVGKERYHHGEFRLQRTGRPYGRDGDAPHVEGNWRVIFFADRRGHRLRPTNPKLREKASTIEEFEQTKQRFGGLVPVILPDDDDGFEGLVTTIDKPFSRLGHVDASFDEARSWDIVGDRSIAVTLMGDHEGGPVVIVQRTKPGAEATPELSFESDVFRCVIAGSQSQGGGSVLRMGDTCFHAGGDPWEAVEAGPEGLDEIIIIGDRRGSTPATGTDSQGWASYLIKTIGHLRSELTQTPPH
jgi:hypothetical protein